MSVVGRAFQGPPRGLKTPRYVNQCQIELWVSLTSRDLGRLRAGGCGGTGVHKRRNEGNEDDTEKTLRTGA
jgi:hypothetical protein